MKSKAIRLVNDHAPDPKTSEDFRILANQIVQFENQSASKTKFFQRTSELLLDFSGCDVIEIWLKKEHTKSDFTVIKCTKHSFQYQNIPYNSPKKSKMTGDESDIEQLCKDIIHRSFDPSSPFFTPKGSFWALDAGNPLVIKSKDNNKLLFLFVFGNQNQSEKNTDSLLFCLLGQVPNI